MKSEGLKDGESGERGDVDVRCERMNESGE